MKNIRFPIIAVSILGFVSSLFLFYLVDQLQYEETENNFNNSALEVVLMVRDSVLNQIDCFDYIKSFFSASNDINVENFQTYLNALDKNYLNINSITWIPYQGEIKGFSLRYKEGKFYPVEEPIPFIQNERIAGLDLKMDLIFNLLLKESLNGTVASSPIRQNGNTDVYFMNAISDETGIKGFIVISLNIQKLVHDTIEVSGHQHMHFRLWDVSPEGGGAFVPSTAERRLIFERNTLPFREKHAMTFARSIAVENRIWKLECEADRRLFVSKFNYAYVVLIFGLLMTGIITHYLWLLVQKHEVAREESERKLRFIWDNVPDGIIEVDKWGNVLFANNAFSDVVADEMIGESVFKYMAENEKFVLATALERAVKYGDTQTYETFIETSEKMFYFYNRIIAIKHKAKEPTFLVISTDITERKKSEETLKQKERQLRQIIDSLPHTIFARDKEGYYKLVNKALAKTYGMTTEELIGMHYRDIPATKEYYDRVMAEDNEVITKKKNKYILESYVNHEGETRIIETIKIPYELEDNETAVLGISVDITDIKQAEAQLEKTVQELTRSNAELERFAYIASHDLQEPLRTVHAYTQLLEEHNKDLLDAESQEYIGYITKDVAHLSSLVKALLVYSRMSHTVAEHETVDCNQIMEYVLNNLKSAIQDSGASVRADVLPIVSASKVHITQLFQNLISNALKYKKQDVTPEIYIGVTQKKDHWEFSVKDNGIGIDSEYYHKIFEAFHRLHSKHEYQGTGIGLAICKKAVESFGGEIWVESKLDKGTTFYFSLPIE